MHRESLHCTFAMDPVSITIIHWTDNVRPQPVNDRLASVFAVFYPLVLFQSSTLPSQIPHCCLGGDYRHSPNFIYHNPHPLQLPSICQLPLALHTFHHSSLDLPQSGSACRCGARLHGDALRLLLDIMRVEALILHVRLDAIHSQSGRRRH